MNSEKIKKIKIKNKWEQISYFIEDYFLYMNIYQLWIYYTKAK